MAERRGTQGQDNQQGSADPPATLYPRFAFLSALLGAIVVLVLFIGFRHGRAGMSLDDWNTLDARAKAAALLASRMTLIGGVAVFIGI
jgi:hypothetical protein